MNPRPVSRPVSRAAVRSVRLASDGATLVLDFARNYYAVQPAAVANAGA